MILKIENRTYSHQGDNIGAISATLNIYNAGGNIVASRDVCATADLSRADFAQQISDQIGGQVEEFSSKFAYLDKLRLELFPNSIDFADAVDQLLDPIQTAIGG